MNNQTGHGRIFVGRRALKKNIDGLQESTAGGNDGREEDGTSTRACQVYCADNAPLAMATFSPKGSCGDRISSGSFGANAPATSTTGESDMGTSFSLDLGESVGWEDL